MSIYRTAYPKDVAMRDPVVRERWGNKPPVWEYWLGPGMYMGVFISDELVTWGFTVMDGQGEATETWEPDTDPEEIVQHLLKVPDWSPAILALVRTAPRGVVHWPLLWRDLQREWVSKGGHVVQVGDSAHTFTPTSGNGATQALEDAATLAACLELSGRGGMDTGTKIYNLLRAQDGHRLGSHRRGPGQGAYTLPQVDLQPRPGRLRVRKVRSSVQTRGKRGQVCQFQRAPGA